jgi:hypothetical protein
MLKQHEQYKVTVYNIESWVYILLTEVFRLVSLLIIH